MKQKLLLIGLLIVVGISTFAKQIDENTAKQVGRNFLSAKTNSPNLKSATNLKLIYKANSQNSNLASSNQPATLFYVLNSGSYGFVIVAGDDNVSPILGYSDKGAFDPDKIPQNVQKWLEGYKKEIRNVIEKNIPANQEIIDEWKHMKNGDALIASSSSGVNPLIQTQWDQAPYYNSLCPDGSVTGCVATAMAQIMKYWEYPATGSGFHSYNHRNYGTLSSNFGSTTYQWSSMPNVVSSSNNAVATLMYQVGISVDMDYSPESSGAWVTSAETSGNCSEYALKTYFGYKSTLQGVQRQNYTQTQWLNLLKTELDAGRPVLYAGFGDGGGHCFVADGYDNNNFIHFNWGWSGYYDGYFQINSLNPEGTGTGGGSGGYNSGHEAVIGIEPPAENQNTDLTLMLYNYVTPSATTINYGEAFTVSTNILNNGSSNFEGDYTAAIFDDSNNFIDYVETFTGYTLQSGYVYTNDIVFSTNGLLSMLPGTYYIGIFYSPVGGNWMQVADNGDYTNLVEITVVNQNDIELNSEMSVNPGTTLTQGQPASVNLNIWNKGAKTFTGQYDVSLYDLEGAFVESIGTYDEINGLPSNYTYLSPFLTFYSTSITASPGTYLLAVEYLPTNSDWQLMGSTDFQNPIKVTVVAAELQADIYETNNSVDKSYNLTVSFSGNNAVVNTIGSNCHITSDNDFYKVKLPTGYRYAIKPALYDLYYKSNGDAFTLDGLFSFSTDGSNWSDAYDDIVAGNIILDGGGIVFIHVAPYFAGQIGTYLFEMEINRTLSNGINENRTDDGITVYPNPANDFVNIDFNEFDRKYDQIKLLDILGKCIFSSNVSDQQKTLCLPLTNLREGIYILQIQSGSGILNKKLIVSK
jgi:hypothetical protein